MTNGEKIKEISPDIEISIIKSKSKYEHTKVAVDWKFEQIPSYYNLFYEDWWNAEYKEPTTKNDLGVDCISREQAKVAIRDKFKDLPSRVEINTILNELPSVTPQEPRWIPVSERLPETDDEVLCWYEYYHWSRGKVLPEYGIGRYLRETSSWFGEVANGKDVRVIAWMPLHPYKAESEVDNG